MVRIESLHSYNGFKWRELWSERDLRICDRTALAERNCSARWASTEQLKWMHRIANRQRSNQAPLL